MNPSPSPRSERSLWREIQAGAAVWLANRQAARKMTLLIFSPPTFGMVFGGALVAIWRAFNEPASDSVPDSTVSYVMAAVSLLVLLGLCLRSLFVRRGSRTQFPKLWRLVPYTACAGILSGLVIALSHARDVAASVK